MKNSHAEAVVSQVFLLLTAPIKTLKDYCKPSYILPSGSAPQTTEPAQPHCACGNEAAGKPEEKKYSEISPSVD